jgi:hypothetical protein
MPISDNKHKILVFIFFLTYLLIGLCIYKDYGVSWDESAGRYRGIASINYALHGDPAIFDFIGRHNGPAYEMFLIGMEKLLIPNADIRTKYFTRHLLIFLTFYIGVVFFYLLCKKRFSSWAMGLLGCLFLILSPRIFAHSFYNSKDIIFLTFFIISIYTLFRYIEDRSLLNILFHAFSCAFLTDIRIFGGVVFLFTLLFAGIDFFKAGRKGWGNGETLTILLGFIFYTSYFIFFVFLLWPFLWPHPLHNFVESIKILSQYPIHRKILYFGQYVQSSNLPWHYGVVSLIIITPLLYTICFCLGFCALVVAIVKNTAQFFISRREDVICLAWFLMPLAYVIILKTHLSGWRHLCFVYPAFLMIALVGINSFFSFVKARLTGYQSKITKIGAFLIIALSLLYVAVFMFEHHPFEDMYYSPLAGKGLNEAASNFEADFWGIHYKEAFEYILKHDEGSLINIYVSNFPGILNKDIISLPDRRRLVCFFDTSRTRELFRSLEAYELPQRLHLSARKSSQAGETVKYFIVDRYDDPNKYASFKKYHSITVDGLEVMTIYKAF